MSAVTTLHVHVVVPDGVDDPGRPSGGNRYDRRAVRELASRGWSVHEHPVPGGWPAPSAADRAALAEVVERVPDGALVVVDGLVGSTAPDVLVPAARRLRLVVLTHMSLADAPDGDSSAETAEREVLAAAAAVVTTSTWMRRRLLERHSLREDRVHVAEPGVDPAGIAAGTTAGGELLCVAAVTPHKGHDVLLAALATLADLAWRCTCVGSLDRDAAFVDGLRRQARAAGIGDRLRFPGPLTGAALDTAYADADALVLASRGESYGMVVTEALARGLPVLATAVGGLPEALGSVPGPDDRPAEVPGLLVPADAPEALADAVRAWLEDPGLRRRLRRTAGRRRRTLSGWTVTGERISRILTELA